MNKTLENKKKKETNVNTDKTSAVIFVVKTHEMTTNNLLVYARFPTLDDYSSAQSAKKTYQSILQYTVVSN